MTVLAKRNIVITGGSGLLGLNWGYQVREIYNPVLGLHARKIQASGLQTQELTLESSQKLLKEIAPLDPALVVHAAGMTSIEACESNPALAQQVNVDVSRNVARVCSELDIPMVHISTDNLFDGTVAMVDENHPVNPVNVYGKTKAEAELVIQECHGDVLIARTNFYGWGPKYKPSFSDTIIGNLRQGSKVSLFEDVFYTPILISDLVCAVHELLECGSRGVFHVVGDERLSKHAFGHRLAEAFRLDPGLIETGRLADMVNLTARPLDMSMSNAKLTAALQRKIGCVDEQIMRLKTQEDIHSDRVIHEIDPVR